MSLRALRLSSFLAILTASAVASADDAQQQLTLPKGKLVIDAFLTVNLSSGAAFDPVSLSPDIWYGVNDDLTLGLVHSSAGAVGFIGEPGTSLCFGDGCASVYDELGVAARYRLKAPLALDAGLFFLNLSDSLELDAKIGVSGRWKKGKVAFEVLPALYVFLTNRDATPGEELIVPATLGYSVSPKLEIGLQTGLDIPFKNTGDTFSIPLSFLGRYRVNPKFSLGLGFTFFHLIAGTAGGADARSLTIGGSYAL